MTLFVRNMSYEYIAKVIKNEKWFQESSVITCEKNDKVRQKIENSKKLVSWLKDNVADSCNIVFVDGNCDESVLQTLIQKLSGPYYIENYEKLNGHSGERIPAIAVYFCTLEDMLHSRLIADEYFIDDKKA